MSNVSYYEIYIICIHNELVDNKVFCIINQGMAHGPWYFRGAGILMWYLKRLVNCIYTVFINSCSRTFAKLRPKMDQIFDTDTWVLV